MFAIRMQIAGENTRCIGGFEHDCACAVSKQHAGRTVCKIKYAREHFGANDQRSAGRTGFDHGIGHRQRIDKSAADSLYVKGCTTCNTQLILQDTGR